MTNEIKEKIEYLKKFAGIYEGAVITEIEDYITNLQQRIDKAIEYLKSISMDKTPDYIPLKDYKEYHILLNILRGDE